MVDCATGSFYSSCAPSQPAHPAACGGWTLLGVAEWGVNCAATIATVGVIEGWVFGFSGRGGIDFKILGFAVTTSVYWSFSDPRWGVCTCCWAKQNGGNRSMWAIWRSAGQGLRRARMEIST